jgi:TIR domain
MEHDVFISHAHKDRNIADAICRKLESAKLRCWLTSRDISASDDRPEATRKAIGSSRVMVLVLSENANAAPHIEREIAHAFYTRRTIIPFRLSNTVPRRSFLFYLDNVSWFDASGPHAEQHLEALALRITDLVPGRSVTGNHKLPQGAIKTAKPLKFRGTLIGALRSSRYRTLNILKRAVIAAFAFGVLCLLWLGFRQNEDLSLVENNNQSIRCRPNDSPNLSSRGTGDPAPSKAGLTFTRFGLWEPANSSPTVVDQQGSQDTPSTSPAARSGSATPSRQSDGGQKESDAAQRLAARESASVTSGQEYLTEITHLPNGPSKKKRSKDHHGTSSASNGPRFAKTKIRWESGERSLATRPERSDEQDVSQTCQIADPATKQNTALAAQIKNAQQDTQQAQRIADLATGQRSALEAQLRKTREENAELVQHDADIAAFYKSDADTQPRRDQGNVQAVREDANLAIDTPGPGQIQPLNPDQNEIPASSSQPLNPPDQPVRP